MSYTYPIYEITDKVKDTAREIKQALKIDDHFVLTELGKAGQLTPELRKRNRKDLADFLDVLKNTYGMEISDILPEIEIDDKFGEELKQLKEEFKI